MLQSNFVLSNLPAKDLSALRPLLRKTFLAHKRVVFDQGDPIALVYFPLTAVLSLVVGLSTGQTIEAAMIGNDGALGISSALDGKASPSRSVVQIAGYALVCDARAFKRVAMSSEFLVTMLVGHEQALYAQAQQTAACLAAHQVSARLARWLLRARDLANRDDLPLTQDFISGMLGVRRTSVTAVARELQRDGLIKYSRGMIQIADVEGLRNRACECYGIIKSQHARLVEVTGAVESRERVAEQS